MTTTTTGAAGRTRAHRPETTGRGTVGVLLAGFDGAVPASVHIPVMAGYAIDVLTATGDPLTGPDGSMLIATTAFADAQVARYGMLALPRAVGPQLQDNHDAIGLLRAFASSGDLRGAVNASPRTIVDAALASGDDAVAWQEVGAGIAEVSGTTGRELNGPALPRHLVRIASRIFEQTP